MRAPIVHLDLGDVFVSVERARRPALAGRPVVIGGRAEGPGRVAAASAEARAAGVAVGQPLREAAARCRGACFLPGDLDAYGDAADRADLVVRRTFRRVEWVSLNEAYIDAADLETAANGPPRVRRRAARPLLAAIEATQAALEAELGLTAACGVAASKVAARIASGLARPSGVLYLFPGYDARFMAPLALDLLPELPRRLQRTLASHGIETLGALAGLSDDLAAALGADVRRWQRLAAGDDHRAVCGTEAPRALAVRRTFDEATGSRDVLAGHVRALARELAAALASHRLLARQLTVRAIDWAQTCHSATVTTTDAVVDRQAAAVDRDEGAAGEGRLAAAAVRGLERALAWPRAVRSLSLRASSLSPAEAQPSLFPAGDGRLAARRTPAGRLARRLRTLVRVQLADDRGTTRRAS